MLPLRGYNARLSDLTLSTGYHQSVVNGSLILQHALPPNVLGDRCDQAPRNLYGVIRVISIRGVEETRPNVSSPCGPSLKASARSLSRIS